MRKLISLITLLSFSAQAATITDDKLTVGKKASASAKEIVFDTNDGAANKKLSVDKVTKKLSITSDETIIGDGTQSDKALTFNRGGSNAQVKWNELTDKLQFSNDGTTFKDLGTGGGGGGSTGVNVLTNDSFEDAVGGVLTDWSNTGGTLTQQTYTNSVEGDAKYFQFVATGAGQYFEMVKTVPTNFNGQGCQADFKKLNIATADLFKVEALDGSNNVLASANVGVSSWQKFPTLSFACPSAGSTFKIRVTSLAAGTLQGDKAYLGSNQNLVNVSQAKLVGTLRVSGCQNSGSSTSWANFPTTTGCTYSATGNIAAPPTMTPSFVINKAQKGDYLIVYSGSVVTPLGGVNARLRITDGNFISNSIFVNAGTPTEGASVSGNTVNYRYSRANYSESVTLTLQHIVSSSSYSVTVGNSDTTEWSIWFYPSDSETAVNTDQASWFIDANIGGGNINLGVSNVSSYTVPEATSIDLVINSNKGSATAQIACASGTASSGLTCSSNESLGISFIPPMAGTYEACFNISQDLQTAASSTINTTYQLIETSELSTSILSEGNQRSAIGLVAGSSNPYNKMAIEVCGSFVFKDTSKKTIRLAYEQVVSGSPTASLILADRDASNGQRDIHVTVRPLLSAYNRPILTSDQVTTRGATKPELISIFYGGSATSVCTTAICPYTTQIGDSFTSIERLGLGSMRANFSRTFSKVNCAIYGSGVAAANAFGTYGIPSLGVGSCTNCNNLPFLVSTNNGAADSTGTVLCHVQP